VTAHSDHGPTSRSPAEREQLRLGERARPVYNISLICGFVGIIGAVLLGYFSDPGFRRFYFAYLVSYSFFLAIALGALAFVILQFLTRAGWSVSVLRIAEGMAMTLPVLGALSAPIVISVLLGHGDLYRWAQPLSRSETAIHETSSAKPVEATQPPTALAANVSAPNQAPGSPDKSELSETPVIGQGHPSARGIPPLDEVTLAKRGMLNPIGFTIRIIFYFAVWSAMALWYWKGSVRQDTLTDSTLIDRITDKFQTFGGPGILILAVTMTFAAFDLLMSLDPHWYSTIFGFYFIAASMLAMFSALVVVLVLLQKLGYLGTSVTHEHYHDLGKWMFCFVFFWGYIAFSQYMLLWYSNIPEEVAWLAHRGATTALLTVDKGGSIHAGPNGFSWWSIALLFGELLIPFAGLLSRHVKRNNASLTFWAIWILVFHYVNMYWLVMPELDGAVHFGLVEILCFIGIGGICMATMMRLLSKHALRPVHDPRVMESLAFENF
jgi:hypothetical protein